MTELALALVGLAAVAGISWLPDLPRRALGALFLAALATLALRGPLAELAAPGPVVLLTSLLAWLAFRRLPSRALERVASLVPSLLLLVYVTTWLMYLAPGSPFAGERAVAPHVEAALRAQYGVPESASAFFRVYLERLVVEGTLGPSLKVQGRSVGDLLLPALPVSLVLGVAALSLAVAIGLLLGVLAGSRPGRAEDHAASAAAILGLSLPNFVIGAGLLAVFSLSLGWFPAAGWGSPAHVVLPALTLALPYAAVIARLARGGLIEAMREDYIRTARAKGLPERVVVLRHALRGALLPVVSFLGPAAAGILTGSFVVESLFGIPGMGQWFVKGAINRDYSVVLGTALFYASLLTVLNLAVDLLYGWLDPRLRESV